MAEHFQEQTNTNLSVAITVGSPEELSTSPLIHVESLPGRSTTHAVISLLDHPLDSRNPVIVKAVILTTVSVISLIGNSIALATIRMTPKLRTKTFLLLSNLTVSDLVTGPTMFWYIGYQLLVYVFAPSPCSYIKLVAVLSAFQRYPLYVSITTVALIAIERYVAIVHPLRYESWMTDTTLKRMIAVGWLLSAALCLTFLLFIGRINWTTCTITASVIQSIVVDIGYILLIFTMVITAYSHILMIALRQHARIKAESTQFTAAQQGLPASLAAAAAGKKFRTEMKAVRLTASVVGVLILLWSPYIIGRMIQASGSNPLLGQYISDVGMVMGIGNSSVNWIIYGAASNDFRKAVWNLVRKHSASVNPTSTSATAG